MRLGGQIVLADLTPADQYPPMPPASDPVRKFRLNDPRMAATELLTHAHAVIPGHENPMTTNLCG